MQGKFKNWENNILVKSMSLKLAIISFLVSSWKRSIFFFWFQGWVCHLMVWEGQGAGGIWIQQAQKCLSWFYDEPLKCCPLSGWRFFNYEGEKDIFIWYSYFFFNKSVMLCPDRIFDLKNSWCIIKFTQKWIWSVTSMSKLQLLKPNRCQIIWTWN